MKALFLTRRFYPDVGGVEKHVLEISKQLIKKGYEVVVISEQARTLTPKNQHNRKILYQSIGKSDRRGVKSKQPVKSSCFEHFRVGKIEVFSFDYGQENWYKKFRIWRVLYKNKKIFEDADVVHCHDVFFWYLPFRFLYPYKRVFTTFHGYEGYPVKIKNILIRKLSEILSDGNICVGKFMKKWYGANPNYIIYGGVNVPKILPKQKKALSGLFVGRLDEQTNILDYVKAVQLIRKRNPKFEFVVAGDGKYRNQVEKQFKVLGFIDEPEKMLLKYRFAFVSRYLSILEALASKRMVFALYDNPIKEDYLKMAPFSKWISISSSPRELAGEVEKYINNPEEAEEMLNEGYKWAKKHTWRRVADLYLKLWQI